MKGTEKQIAWAEDIKTSAIKTCAANAQRFETIEPKWSELYSKIGARCKALIKKIEENPDAENASWWIDNRNRLPNANRVFDQVSTMISNGVKEDDALTRLFGF